MSFPLPQSETGLGAAVSGLHVPAGTGITRWVFGDTYTAKLTAELTNGSLGLLEATVPPGGGPVAHTHANEDEIFVITDGDLEFLVGEKIVNAHTGDVVFVPRTLRHRFHNTGVHAAKMFFLYTPGGGEGVFMEAGDEPTPGQQAPMWGPERLGVLGDLLVKYGIDILPED